MNRAIESVVHMSWSFLKSTENICRRLVPSSCLKRVRSSFTPKSVKHWKPSIATVTATATMNQPLGVLPSAPVTGSQATMMANMPTFAHILANAPMFSRFF